VRVEWAQVTGNTPGGDFDLWVAPWNSNYESPDIWIDRGDDGKFDYVDPKTGEPIGNGDKPRPKSLNKIYGRVHNDGRADATNVQVKFYAVTPPGVGDNGNWGPLVPPPPPIPLIRKQSSQTAEMFWVPEVGQHTCLRVYVEPQPGEINAGGNNWAQENIFYFDAPAPGYADPDTGYVVAEPVAIEVAVRNPLKVATTAFISVRNVPESFTVQFPHSWVRLEPLQERRFSLHVVPTQHITWDVTATRIANIIVDGRIPHVYEQKLNGGTYPASTFWPIGGILARVTPKRTVRVKVDVQKVPDPDQTTWIHLRVKCTLNPPLPNEEITIELMDPANRRHTVSGVTDGSGGFTARFPPSTGPGGEILHGVHVLTAYVFNSPHAADAQPAPLYVTT
jgi:hypothetical protein